ncbi:MAG TPA: lipopolysaccharide heptosyltransferase family protein [Candidatus Pelagibacter sp.]|jgi:ADP-heptose:LPS heptosyltransferase|nr:lipopolysaccharide heptosyltransferase family protein [Candidatus Pelagibacter sp.]
MSNILIIKHGSLGDIAQIAGVLRDIRENFNDKKIFILTTSPYKEILEKCPHVDVVLIDKRLPRWNLYYLIKLKNMIKKYNFKKIYDLQNSSRTSFYKKYLFSYLDWSNSTSLLETSGKKIDLNSKSVLERFKMQLDYSNMNTQHALKPDFSWACSNVDSITGNLFKNNFLLIFPFSSPKLPHKQWPYYNELIKTIKKKHVNLQVGIVPGPNEIEMAKKIDAILVTTNNRFLNIMELAGLIKKSSFVIANDTGPAHMAAHLDKKGIVLFGYHTTPYKVSIETDKFRALAVNNLADLSAETVYSKIENNLKLIN